MKKKAHKVSPKKKPEEQAKKTVLVGTYKGDQLEKWPGYYNYPISSKDKIDVESAKKVNELWLFQGAKAGRYFSAEYVGTFTRDELKTKFGYPAKGKPHGDKYLLYKITKTDIYDPATGLVEAVIVRAKDFKTASRTGRQIKAYLESPERKDPVTANLVPKILTELPREVLRVCEVAVQDRLVQWSPVVGVSPLLGKIESIVMSIGEFGRIHSLSSGESYAYLKKYKGLEYIDKYHEPLSCFPMESLVDDLAQVCRNNGGELR